MAAAARAPSSPFAATARRNGREGSMLDGVVLLWFVLTAAALLFVAVDIRTTPESAVLKWGFVLLTAYTGVGGAFLFVLGCREPLPGLHERYVGARWRQTLGSTMHCVAGDGVGILAGAVLSSVFVLPAWSRWSSNTFWVSPSVGRFSRRCSCATWLAALICARCEARSSRNCCRCIC